MHNNNALSNVTAGPAAIYGFFDLVSQGDNDMNTNLFKEVAACDRQATALDGVLYNLRTTCPTNHHS